MIRDDERNTEAAGETTADFGDQFLDELDDGSTATPEAETSEALPSGSALQDFGALTAIERASVTKAAELLKGLAEAEAAENADDQAHSEGVSRRRHRQLWLGSVLISIACVLAVIGMSISVYTAPTRPDPADTVMTDHGAVTRYLGAHVPASARGAEPVFIPTGLEIESIEFRGPYTLDVSGRIWQRYANDLPNGIIKGVSLPEAKEQPTFTEMYRKQLGNEEVRAWTFHATLREKFDYSRYPFGRHQIKVRMRHPDSERNVYLTPDLKAYASIDPTATPGVDPTLVLENWHIQQAFFSYRTNRDDDSLGSAGSVMSKLRPDLYYSIAVKRDLVTPFISRTIVPIVILIQLFIVVTVLSRKHERLEHFGVLPGTVVFTAAAFFFTVVLGHNALRDEVKAPGLSYIECLYIVTYCAIIGVALNAVLLVGQPNLKLFRGYDNIWVKVLYWPVIWLTLLVVTVLTFYT